MQARRLQAHLWPGPVTTTQPTGKSHTHATRPKAGWARGQRGREASSVPPGENATGGRWQAVIEAARVRVPCCSHCKRLHWGSGHHGCRPRGRHQPDAVRGARLQDLRVRKLLRGRRWPAGAGRRPGRGRPRRAARPWCGVRADLAGCCAAAARARRAARPDVPARGRGRGRGGRPGARARRVAGHGVREELRGDGRCVRACMCLRAGPGLGRGGALFAGRVRRRAPADCTAPDSRHANRVRPGVPPR
jgi:hypothetical protein